MRGRGALMTGRGACGFNARDDAAGGWVRPPGGGRKEKVEPELGWLAGHWWHLADRAGQGERGDDDEVVGVF